jgi:hypothetical protein
MGKEIRPGSISSATCSSDWLEEKQEAKALEGAVLAFSLLDAP